MNGPPAVQLPPLTDARLVKAYAHPTRVKILSVLAVTSSTPMRLAEDIGEPPDNVHYHIKVLRGLDCIERVASTDVHGGRVKQHFYRATRQPLMHLDAWDKLSDREKHTWVGATMRIVTQNVEDSMRGGIFLDPDDGHLSRIPVTIDQEAWAEATAVLDRAAEEIFEIQARASERLKENEEPGFHAKVVILQFRHQDPF